MKRLAALTAIGVYLTLNNYCLAYSLVTGESHDPYKNVAAEKKEASHPGCHGHEEATPSEKPDHRSQGNTKSDTCCVTLTKCLESTRPRTISVSAPQFNLENVLAPVPHLFIDLHLVKTWLSNHGPPGVTASQGFLSSSSSRAPPFLLS